MAVRRRWSRCGGAGVARAVDRGRTGRAVILRVAKTLGVGVSTVQRVKAEMSAALVGVMAGADVTTHAVRAMEAR